MTSIKSTFKPRLSLCPPRGDRDAPNAAMVDASNVEISIKKHNRQRDQETETKQEQEIKLNEQRNSLFNAVELVKNWKNICSPNDLTNVQKNNDQIKK
jgi:hypothetical protein